MEQHEVADTGGTGDVDHVLHRGVTPSDLGQVVRRLVLRVVHQDVGTRDELDMFGVAPP